jgi:hypothetical protein
MRVFKSKRVWTKALDDEGDRMKGDGPLERLWKPINRRTFFAGAVAFTSLYLTQRSFGQGQTVDVNGIGIDLAEPWNHCNQDHQHNPLPPGIDPYDQLRWSAGDRGHNEGADEALALLLQYGFGLPPGVTDLARQSGAAGELWKRQDMMNFAKSIRYQNLPCAVGLCILSQWHNCHAFRTLEYNPLAVINWLNN